MLGDVLSQPIPFELQDIELYWKGRTYIEAAHMAHLADEDPYKNTISYEYLAPFLEQAAVKIRLERSTVEEGSSTLPAAKFDDDNELEPRFVVMLALLIDSEKPVEGKAVKALARLSKAEKDKKIIIVLGGVKTQLGRALLEEMQQDRLIVSDTHLFSEFENVPRGVRQKPEYNMSVRDQHQARAKANRNQMQKARMPRTNFKGRGR